LGVEGESHHSLAVYQTGKGDWSDAWLVTKTRLDCQDVPLFVLFPDLQYQVLTGGINRLTFWKICGRDACCKHGSFGTRKAQVLLNAGVLNGDMIVTGTQNGNLYAWKDSVCDLSQQAHDGPILSLAVAASRNVIVSGSIDGVLKIWDKDLVAIKTIDLSKASTGPPASSIIRSLAVDTNLNRIAAGLKSNEIIETVVDVASTMGLLHGFGGMQLTSISPHPNNPDLYVILSQKEVRLY